MSNASFARLTSPLVFSSWTTIRLAIRFRITDSGANLTGTPRFAMGLYKNTTNLLGDASVDHFVGVRTYAATWTRATSETRYTGVVYTAMKQVGSTVTDASASGVVGTLIPHTAFDKLFFIDITKGSPNYTFNSPLYVNASGTSSPTSADFLTQSVSGSPSFTGHGTGTSRTLAVDETTDGTLNAAGIWWNSIVTTIDICDWRVIKMA